MPAGAGRPGRRQPSSLVSISPRRPSKVARSANDPGGRGGAGEQHPFGGAAGPGRDGSAHGCTRWSCWSGAERSAPRRRSAAAPEGRCSSSAWRRPDRGLAVPGGESRLQRTLDVSERHHELPTPSSSPSATVQRSLSFAAIDQLAVLADLIDDHRRTMDRGVEVGEPAPTAGHPDTPIDRLQGPPQLRSTSGCAAGCEVYALEPG